MTSGGVRSVRSLSMIRLEDMDGDPLNKSSNPRSPVLDTCGTCNPMSERDADHNVYTPGDTRLVGNTYEFLTDDGRWVPIDTWADMWS